MFKVSKKLQKKLDEVNKNLKKRDFFKHLEIKVDNSGFLSLSTLDGYHHFPIGIEWVENDREAIIAIDAYFSGLCHNHNKDKSYVHLIDEGQ